MHRKSSSSCYQSAFLDWEENMEILPISWQNELVRWLLPSHLDKMSPTTSMELIDTAMSFKPPELPYIAKWFPREYEQFVEFAARYGPLLNWSYETVLEFSVRYFSNGYISNKPYGGVWQAEFHGIIGNSMTSYVKFGGELFTVQNPFEVSALNHPHVWLRKEYIIEEVIPRKDL